MQDKLSRILEMVGKSRFMPLGIAALFGVAAVVALLVTLPLLKEDFDGLNNLAQLPFAFPWLLIPLPSMNHETRAYVDAGYGVVNAVVLFVWLRRRQIRQAYEIPVPPGPPAQS